MENMMMEEEESDDDGWKMIQERKGRGRRSPLWEEYHRC
jgi:hypothetical protein